MIAKEVRDLIRTMWRANPTWGAPRIVGELGKLGIDVTKSTVETYRIRPPEPPSPTWKTFLTNHVPDLVALDFLVVPSVRHTVLFVLVILVHHRRRVVHFNVTEHPTAAWTAQQVIEAFPWDEAPRDLRRDRDRIYGASFRQRIRNMGIEEVVIAPRRPWQNPSVKRLIGSIRRECLDHIIVLHERHLRRLLTDYFQYDHHWRTHRALDMDGPLPRPVQRPGDGSIREVPEVGGCITMMNGKSRDDMCADRPVCGCNGFAGPTGNLMAWKAGGRRGTRNVVTKNPLPVMPHPEGVSAFAPPGTNPARRAYKHGGVSIAELLSTGLLPYGPSCCKR